MSNIQNHPPTTDTMIEVVHNRYQKFKTLVLKLKSNNSSTDFSSLTPDQLDQFVDETINHLEQTLLSNINDLRERIKLIRPNTNDCKYNEKIIIYQELLEQTILIMKKIQFIINKTLDQLHILIDQLWIDIQQNNANNIQHLLSEYYNTNYTFINQIWIKDINTIEATLNALY